MKRKGIKVRSEGDVRAEWLKGFYSAVESARPDLKDRINWVAANNYYTLGWSVDVAVKTYIDIYPLKGQT